MPSPAHFLGWPAGILAALILSACSNQPLDRLYRARERMIVAKLNPPATAPRKSPDPGAVIVPETFVEPTDAPTRNKVINQLVLVIDDHYFRYEYHRYTAKAWGTYVGDVVGIGLSTAGTLTGTESTKTLLSALVTALQGSSAALEKDVLQGQTIIAIVAQMRKARAAKMLDIRRAMGQSLEAYPFDAALVDLLEYYYAGTYLTALQSLTEDAAANAKDARKELRNLRFAYGADSATDRLRDYWKPGGVVDADHAAALRDWIENNTDAPGISPFLYDAQYADDRAAAAAALLD